MTNAEIKKYAEEKHSSMLETLKELCHIPAPSHFEHQRAEYCKKWLEDKGAKGVYIDKALNVIFPINCENSNEITIFVAHTDTVFPDTEPMPYREDEENIYCPGVGDDTASVSVLMHTAEFFIENNLIPQKGVMFVLNSCEEGLGNLKGTRQLFKDFEGRIGKFISFDGKLTRIANRCAGSHRYEVEVLTRGGHSYQSFGNANAINELSKIVNKIYSIEVPQMEGERTTYNVGGISGGTSVNTIAQSAKMLCEYRSSHKDCLAIMQKKFEEIFESAKSDEVQVNVIKIGDRPCSNIDFERIDDLEAIIEPILEEIIKKPVGYASSSTDCNIPLSLGIPAICVGVYNGAGAHTREEWVEKKSLVPGLEFGIKIAKALTGV